MGAIATRRSSGSRRRWARPWWSGRTPMRRFSRRWSQHPEFRAGRFDTGFIDRHLAELTRVDPAAEAAAIAAAVEALLRAARHGRPNRGDAWADPWAANDGFSLGPARAVRSRHHGRRSSREGDASTWRDGAHVTVDGVAARATACGSCRSARGMVAIGDGVQRHVALKSYDIDRRRSPRRRRRRQGADARQGAGDLRRGRARASPRASASRWSRR